jgi:hypothetical protein
MNMKKPEKLLKHSFGVPFSHSHGHGYIMEFGHICLEK